MFMPRDQEKWHKFYDDMGSIFSSDSVEKTSTADDSSVGWSTGVNESTFEDEYDSSCISFMERWYRKQSKKQKALYVLGTVTGLIILVVIFREWGLAVSSNKAGVDMSLTPSPSIPSATGPSEQPPSSLPWTTQAPTSKDLPVPAFTKQPTVLTPSTETPATAEPPVHFWVPGPPNTPPSTINAPTAEFPSSSPLTSVNETEQPLSSPISIPSQRPVTNIPASQPSSSPTTTLIKVPTSNPTGDAHPPSYVPGNLIVEKLGLLLSEGLDARLLAMTNEKVEYDLGGRSREKFHDQPDAGATFPDPRSDENPGGWIYVSNSEVDNRKGGVGALTFDRDGNVLDYQMILEKTNMNCGGGRTPWNTWVSCEEVEFSGLIYQVDPTGEREPQVMTLGSDGGRWESFAYDIRDRSHPYYFATEDHNKGTIRRFTPNAPDWDEPWDMLHGPGITDYLMIFPNSTNDGGTFTWTDDFEGAKNNARAFYPQTEGIDVYGNQLFYVCKRIQQLFVLNLDDGTYYNHTTVNGLFDGKPDQMQRVLDDPRELLYFTEEGGRDAGVHARDHFGNFYTVFESPVYADETTGLSFSPDGRFLYIAYQHSGRLFQIWREDGFPFQANSLDVKYHHTNG